MRLHPLTQRFRGSYICAATQLPHIQHPALPQWDETLLAMDLVCFLPHTRAYEHAHMHTHTHTHMHTHTHTHTHTHACKQAHVHWHCQPAGSWGTSMSAPLCLLAHRLADFHFGPAHWHRRLVQSGFHFTGEFTVVAYVPYTINHTTVAAWLKILSMGTSSVYCTVWCI